jgi:hypothetical protein
MGVRRDLIEQRAARIVAGQLGGTFGCRDTGAQRNHYDFDIELPDGRVVALEVTEHADQAWLSLLGALDKHGSKISAPTLERGWYLYLAEASAGYKALWRQVNEIAPSRLASLGLQEVRWFNEYSPYPEAREICRLGITDGSCHSYPGPGGGFITIMPPGGGGAIGPALVASAALQEANKNDNLAKLRKAATDERHLFVWISRMLPWMSFGDGPPTEVPELPQALTTLWVADLSVGTIHLWRAVSGRGWEEFTATV